MLAFTRILQTIRREARGVSSDPVTAVHEYRKAIRRARALVELLRPALGGVAARGSLRRLKAVFRKTGGLRDVDVLLATLDRLPDFGSDTVAARIVLEQKAKERPNAERTAEILARGLDNLRGLPTVLEVVLPEEYSTRDLEAGLSRTYRRVRRALDRARESSEPADFHEWRKKVKELRYQVELLSGARGPLSDRERQLGRFARDLGGVTDLFLLHRELATSDDGSAVSANLLAHLDGLAAERSRRLIEQGRDLFDESPKGFAARVLADRG